MSARIQKELELHARLSPADGRHDAATGPGRSAAADRRNVVRSAPGIIGLQGRAGNAAVAALLVQRDDDPASPDVISGADPAAATADPATADPAAATVPTEPVDRRVDLSAQEPIPVPARELGDFPQPDPNAPTVQTDGDDDNPHPSADIAVQYPWSYQGTLIYRNLNLAQIRSLHLDIGHEPQLSVSISPGSGLSVQYALTLLNWHWTPPWSRELEVGLSGIVNQTLLPQASLATGGQVQAEQHIVKWFSITLGVSGMYTPGQRGRDGHFDLGVSPGALFHFN